MPPKLVHVLFLLSLCTHSAYSTWEFAVTTKDKITLYDEHWNVVTTAAHQFDDLSAVAFDEAEEVVYFNDRQHNNGSLFSVKIPSDQDEPHIVDKIVQRTRDESVAGIAYDPHNRNLYWSDKEHRKIYFQPIDAAYTDAPKLLIDFAGERTQPDGIAIDICRRKLYYTNSDYKNASVERIDLDGSGRTVIARDDMYMPHGIVVDQLTDRIYWVVDQQGIYYTVESANLEGGDRVVVVRGTYNVPHSLAVTKDAIYWTDISSNNAIWTHAKHVNRTANATVDDTGMLAGPHEVLRLARQPNGIVGRTHYLRTLQNDAHCAGVVTKIKNRLLAPKPTRSPVDVRLEKLRRKYCLNGGEYSDQSGVCVCSIGYKGARCETSECHNYCVHGSCAMSPMGFPSCTCQRGFHGERCQSHKCRDHCLNDAVCRITDTDQPSCECKGYFGGERCEKNSTEICSLYCRILKHEPQLIVPYGCYDICAELMKQSEDGADAFALPKYEHLEPCVTAGGLGSNVIVILCVALVVSLCLGVLLINGVRRFYKPARPRIKKTFVVRKHASSSPDTPLTNRPMATEQCEITIENCCNMNICDTPCFDPKLVQQTLGCDSNGKSDTKEDKKILIHNMEDELY